MEIFPAVFLFTLSATITPGPNNVMLMASGMNFGIRRSIPHLLGVCLGFTIMVILVGSGLGFIFEQSRAFHETIKIIGVLYLLYLAWRIANSAPTSLEGGKSRPLNFMEAALFQWVNPKAWIMASGAVAAFTTAGSAIQLQVMVIALGFFSVSFPCAGTWLCFGVGLKKLFASPGLQRTVNRAMALLLVASILPVILELVRQYFP
ncbi:MAG: LysE family translocator [Desulfobacterales bacterium]|nr:LysE family translocator [Desulfobacterales bacterium]